MRSGNHLDHLWLRVSDLERATAFYDEISPFSGFRRVTGLPGHAHFAGAPGERSVYHPGYYGAFVLDPAGHNVEVVNRRASPSG